jgi:cytochrome c553
MGLSNSPGTPHLAGQPAIYLVEQLQNFKSGKRQNPVMSVIAKPLGESDIQDMAAWYASIEIQLKPQ